MKSEMDFYIAIIDEDGKDLIYSSEGYKISEVELLQLIKILYKDRRAKSIGRKILDVYKDSTLNRKKLTEERLNRMGIAELSNKEIYDEPKTKERRAIKK